jgi:hypothetical protein
MWRIKPIAKPVNLMSQDQGQGVRMIAENRKEINDSIDGQFF